MKITAFVEFKDGIGFRATSLVPSGIVGEGPTRDDALTQLTQRIHERFGRGEIAEFHVQLPGEEHPWMSLAGIWKDHPDIAEVEENIREYRRQVDADPNRP